MGKKEKKKGKGKEKTEMKTERKMTAKQKKHLAAMGEEDIEKIIAEIEEEERKRLQVKESKIGKPTRRANFTFCSHPLKDELILFGGEYFNGQKTVVYNDLIFYNIAKNEWTLVQAPSPPPPRCGHQMVALAKGKGQLWLFGGEFVNSTQNQFHHYKDLWVFHADAKKWEKIAAQNGPSPRSGHRMVHNKNFLIVFGGYHDNSRQYKYFNDVHAFDLGNYKWCKLDVSGVPPAPRSGCQMIALPDGKVLVHGGYSKENVKKDVEKGVVHSDSFLLVPEKNDESGLRWKWVSVKLGGARPSPRSGAAATVGPGGGHAYTFGGVFDEEENDEEIRGRFFNELHALDLDKRTFRQVVPAGPKAPGQAKKRRRQDKAEAEEEEDEEGGEGDADVEADRAEELVTVTNGVFTMTVGSSSKAADSGETERSVRAFQPPPRMNCGLAVKHGILYLYGGMQEDGDRQLTLCDMYSLDLHKLDEWRTILSDREAAAEWVSSDSESDAEEDDDDDKDASSEDDEGSAEANS